MLFLPPPKAEGYRVLSLSVGLYPSIYHSLRPCVTNLLVIVVDINSRHLLFIPRQRRMDTVFGIIHPPISQSACQSVCQPVNNGFVMVEDINKTNRAATGTRNIR